MYSILAISFRLAGLALAMILILSSTGRARQLFLNVYVDDTSANKALVVGNVDDLTCLLFLNMDVQGSDLFDPAVSLSYGLA